MKPRIVITLGDPAGIGPEIVAAAIQDPGILACCEPVVVGDPAAFVLHGLTLPHVEMLSVAGLNKKLPLGRPSREAGKSALETLRQGMALIRGRQAQGLVTAPVSKESFRLAGFKFPGHTEWLAQKCQAHPVAMLMVAGPLRAVLMTRHVPIADVPRRLNTQIIKDCATLAWGFLHRALAKKRPRMAICGLNPHAGDGGLLGHDERNIMQPALNALHRRGLRIEGPLPADSVFRDLAQGRYDLALAAYHDQGMIPLKLYAPDKLVNVTLGLPFIRTSPGHGTAYDIVGKRRANPESMMEAIRLAALYSSSY